MVVERLWDKWKILQARTDALASVVQVPAEDSAHHDKVFMELVEIEEELESHLQSCPDGRLTACIRISIALRHARVAGEESERHWLLVADALVDLSRPEIDPGKAQAGSI